MISEAEWSTVECDRLGVLLYICPYVDQETMASSLNEEHPWFEICHSRPTAKYQVFIFPAAGPSSIIYAYYLCF